MLCVLAAPMKGVGERGHAIKVYCHLCGATLRGSGQSQKLDTLTHQDTIYICSDEKRCGRRAAQDPLTGKPHREGYDSPVSAS